jgi:uncharacterized RDD family membrane protein YckC
MENGSTPRPAASANGSRNGQLPLPARLLGAGVRGARTVTRATGIDRAVETAAEEAIVAAVESEAVERALARVLEGPVVEEAVQGALESDAVKQAVIDALDSELVDEVWRRLLASEEAQQLVERIAEAPELRAAIRSQSTGLIADIGRSIGRLARRLDDTFERIVRRLFFRPRRAEPSDRAGAVSRALAFALDGAIVNLLFSALVAIVALIVGAISGTGHGVSGAALAVGGTAWLTLGGLYLLAFWSLVGQTPGMRFLGIEINVEGGLPLRRSLRRLLGLALSVLSFGIGFLGIVFGERRRGWEDSLAGADVVYEEPAPERAPWSTLAPAEPASAGNGQTALPLGPSASL